MVSNPFQDGISVEISSATDGFTGGIDSAVSKLGDFQKELAIIGGALATFTGVALSNAVDAARDFEDAMVDVEKVTDAETAEAMSDAIKGMADEMPVAHEELAEIAATAGRLGVGEDDLESFTETVAMMATATDLGAGEAADAFARISTLMDLPMEDAELLGSAINELANNFGTSASEITDAMTRAGGAMESLGVGEDEALGLAAAMNEVSPSARVAGTSLRNISESLMDPNTVAGVAEALGMTEEEFRNMRDEDPGEVIRMLASSMNEGGDQAEELRGVLGKQASDLQALGSNMDSVEGATEAAGQQFEDGTSLQEEFAVASSTFNAEMQMLRNQLNNVAIEIGSVILPYLSEFVAVVSRIIGQLSEWNSRTNGVAGALILIGGLLTGLVMLVGAVIPAIGGLAGVMGVATGAAAALATGIGLILSPIGLVIIAIAALAAAWKMNLFGIQDITREVFNEIAEFVSMIMTFIHEELLEPILLAIREMWELHGEAILEETREVFQAIQDVIDRVMTFVWEEILTPILGMIEELWEMHGERVMEIVDFFFMWIELAFETFADTILTGIRVLLALIQGDWEGAFDLIAEYTERWFDRAGQLFSAFKDLVTGIVGDIADAIIGIFEGLYNRLVGNSIIPDMIDDAIAVFTGWVDWIRSGWDIVGAATAIVSDVHSAIVGGFSDIASAAIDALNDLISDALSMGSDAANNFRNAFNDAIPSSVSIPSRSVSIPSVLGGGSVSVGGGSLSLPSLDTGGLITGDGLAEVHAGERVVPAAQVTDRGGIDRTNVNADITVHAQDGTDAGKKIADELDRFL